MHFATAMINAIIIFCAAEMIVMGIVFWCVFFKSNIFTALTNALNYSHHSQLRSEVYSVWCLREYRKFIFFYCVVHFHWENYTCSAFSSLIKLFFFGDSKYMLEINRIAIPYWLLFTSLVDNIIICYESVPLTSKLIACSVRVTSAIEVLT